MEKAGRKQREDFAMTETKYIFPKQMQSVAALVFIAVLIVLLLILTVMVHMRNRKLKSTLEEQIAERRLLDKICADFTAVYYVELNTGFFEIQATDCPVTGYENAAFLGAQANTLTSQYVGYKFGYELLMLNGALTFAGLALIKKRNS